MSKVIINVKDEDINNFSNTDLLVYDATKKQFYKTTAEDFYAPYEDKLNKLLERYDKKVSELENENQKIRNDYSAMKQELQNFLNDFTNTEKQNMLKLTNMVEKFIDTGGK